MSKREVQHVKKQKEDQVALKRVREVYPQCSVVLSITIRHANGVLAKMDFSVNGTIQRASNVFGDETNFEPNFYAGWAHTRRSMQPELTSRVNSIIQEC